MNELSQAGGPQAGPQALLASGRIFVPGRTGMVGSAIARRLRAGGAVKLITSDSRELDLRRQVDVEHFFAAEKPEVVILAAARVGGIVANSNYPAEFAYDNLVIASNVIHAAYRSGVARLLFLGSTCIYPREAPQPIPESALLSGPLEQTNEPYALAKIAGLKLCQYYRQQYGKVFHSAMPTNLYGPGDNYHPEHSHVLPALIRRFHEAKLAGQEEVTIWGSGRPRREFLHVDDLAEAIWHLLQLEDPPDWVNVGTGADVSIQELAQLVADEVGYGGRIANDLSRPDGTMQKRTDTSLLERLGWRPKIQLRQGIAMAYASFLDEQRAGTLRMK